VRRLLLLLAILPALAAGTASAAPGDDARAVAERFLTALAQSDSTTACGLFTADALEQLGGTSACRRTLSGSADVADSAAQTTLARALAAARRSARARRGRYVRKGYGLRSLARDMERLDAQLTVVLGRGPRSAAGRLDTTAVLDTRSTARRLVAYAESDDGSIWRLSAAATGAARVEEVAEGIPEAQPKPRAPSFTFTIDRVSVDDDGSALVEATLRPAEPAERPTRILLLLVPTERGLLVEDLFTSALGEGGGGG
jgi:hypothetical protein